MPIVPFLAGAMMAATPYTGQVAGFQLEDEWNPAGYRTDLGQLLRGYNKRGAQPGTYIPELYLAGGEQPDTLTGDAYKPWDVYFHSGDQGAIDWMKNLTPGPYTPSLKGADTTVDPAWNDAAKLAFAKADDALGARWNMVTSKTPIYTLGDNNPAWSPSIGNPEGRDFYELFNSPNQKYFTDYYKSVQPYRRAEQASSPLEGLLAAGALGAVTGGFLSGASFPSLASGTAGGAGDAFGSMAAYDAGTAALGGGGAAATGTGLSLPPGSTTLAQNLAGGSGTMTDVSAPTTGPLGVPTTPTATGLGNPGDIDPAFGNYTGATAPAPTVSVPGIGDVYGDWGTILKSAPGLLNLLKSGGSTSAGGTTVNVGGGGDATLAAILPALLGAVGSYQQSQTIKELADRARSDRAPFLNASTGYLADPNSYFAGPGKAAMDSTLRALSVNGNPIGEGTSMALATQAGLQDWRNTVSGFGNLGLGGENNQTQLGLAGAGADANILNAIGAGAHDIFAPKDDTLAEVLKAYFKKQIG